LDLGEAALARDLLDRYPDDPYCCFAYSSVLIECIALMLEEEDASEENVEAALKKGTNYLRPIRQLYVHC
jgi:hypothetical protein